MPAPEQGSRSLIEQRTALRPALLLPRQPWLGSVRTQRQAASSLPHACLASAALPGEWAARTAHWPAVRPPGCS